MALYLAYPTHSHEFVALDAIARADAAVLARGGTCGLAPAPFHDLGARVVTKHTDYNVLELTDDCSPLSNLHRIILALEAITRGMDGGLLKEPH